MSINKNPAFNLKAVLQETSIAADTLRAWERRYGLPLPQRTAGGHRLYSQYDIETIKWLMARQAEGLSISRAVDLWNERVASGSDPLAGATQGTFTPPAPGASDSNLDALRAQWLEACLDFNEAQAEQVLNQAFAIHPLETVCVQLLQRGLSEMGTQWYLSQASVQQEHFTSALAMRRLDALLSASPAPTRKQTVLVGCPPEELHAFTPLLISLLLRRRGLNVIYLGANVPIQHFVDTVKSVQAAMVVLVAQQLITAASLMQTANELAGQGIPVGFGGRIFTLQPDLLPRIPGHYLGDTVDEAVQQAEALVTSAAPIPVAGTPDPVYVKAASDFEARRPNIEAALKESARSSSYTIDMLKTATDFLGDNITAALQLGEITLVEGEIDWVRELLKGSQIPAEALNEFLQFYAQALKSNLNGSGGVIHEWLNSR